MKISIQRSIGKTKELEIILQELEKFCTYDTIRGGFVATQLRRNIKSTLPGELVGSISGTGYYVIRIQKALYNIHRLVWLWHHGEWPVEQIDHINRNKLDNRIENLRDTLDVVNKRNRRRQDNNISGHTGIYYSLTRKKWAAQITINSKTKYLGIYEDKNQAIEARRAFIKAHPELEFTTIHGV